MYHRKPTVLMVGEAPGRASYNINGNMKENTATIIWDQISQLEKLPLLWNCFPLHPYKKENPESNRRPLKIEKEWGAVVLQELIDIFQVDTLVAIGNEAHQQLNRLNIDHLKLRHPSFGGKKEFVEGLQNVLASKKF